ncbi:FxLYD domain-containing protein [Chengkuizengella axinellae]|uniref:FxLYD domain-containing protein n=1 Tax=Chengkuizengella axinellae TaxID=3064388 RepID=A0ABT9J0Y8_9BACL|nr:FxLYD domain-containing protein [Chengkuizengella sp. 2205SS18-9]MDP5275284.1 FxLYD domain-containing protein [Chengkuizengella sp. 2205SS18-9]
MKKLFVLLTLTALTLALIGCSSDEVSGTSENGKTSTTEENTENTETENTENEEETKDNKVNVEKEEPKESISLEITQQNEVAWVDSIGTVWVHSAAIFENTGDEPVKIGEAQMNFKDQEGGILGTETWLYAVPDIVLPGQKAFITESTFLDGINDPSLFKETSYNFDYGKTGEDPYLMETSGVKGFPGDEYSPYTVTGVVKNTTDKKHEFISVSAALYAEDGSLLGILDGSVDVGVAPGSEAGFELFYPEIPVEYGNQVVSVEVLAYGWDF